MKTEFLISTPGFVGFPVEPITVFPTAGLFTVIWALLLATSVIEFVALSESTAFTITELGLPLLSSPIAVMALFPLSLPPVTEVGVTVAVPLIITTSPITVPSVALLGVPPVPIDPPTKIPVLSILFAPLNSTLPAPSL